MKPIFKQSHNSFVNGNEEGGKEREEHCSFVGENIKTNTNSELIGRLRVEIQAKKKDCIYASNEQFRRAEQGQDEKFY